MPEIKLEKLSQKHLEGVVEVTSEAFYGEAVTRCVYDFSRESVRKSYRLNSEIMALKAMRGGYPALVALEGDRVVGAAMLKSSKAIPFSVTWRIFLPRLPRLLRLILKARHRQGQDLKRKMEPSRKELPPSYITLESLAVSSGHRGKGIGAKLLRELPRVCRDEKASGIYLFTGEEKNRHIYLKNGYRDIKSVKAGPLTIYHMFMPREKGGG